MNSLLAKTLAVFMLIVTGSSFVLTVRCHAQLANDSSNLVTINKYVEYPLRSNYCIELRSDGTFRVGGATTSREGTYTESLIEVVLSIVVPSPTIAPPIPVVAVRKLLVLGDFLVSPETGEMFIKVN